MATEKQQPGGQPPPTAPGKPASRQPPDSNTGNPKDKDEGQELPKTGREGESGGVDQIDRSRSADNP